MYANRCSESPFPSFARGLTRIHNVHVVDAVLVKVVLIGQGPYLPKASPSQVSVVSVANDHGDDHQFIALLFPHPRPSQRPDMSNASLVSGVEGSGTTAKKGSAWVTAKASERSTDSTYCLDLRIGFLTSGVM